MKYDINSTGAFLSVLLKVVGKTIEAFLYESVYPPEKLLKVKIFQSNAFEVMHGSVCV